MFGFGKKEEAKTTGCCCGGTSVSEVKAEPVCACNGNTPEFAANKCCCSGECCIRSIKVLGPGCRSCHELNEAAIAAVKELGMALEVEYITDMEKTVSYGVMSMPALVINGQVVSAGKALKTAEIISLLKKLGYC